jgi:hypothetical protein
MSSFQHNQPGGHWIACQVWPGILKRSFSQICQRYHRQFHAGYAGKRGTLGRLVQSIDNPLDPMLRDRLVEIDP